MLLSHLREIRKYPEEGDERDQGRALGRGKAVELTETKSGIGWKFAGQGTYLLKYSLTHP
jgi:hypothetical protein